MLAVSPPAKRDVGLVARGRRWIGESLVRRLSLATLLLCVLLLVPTAALSLLLTWQLTQRDVDNHLDGQAGLAAGRLAEVLRGAGAEVGDLARSSLLASALTDAPGRNAFALPFLASHQLALPVETGLALTGRDGLVLAGGARPLSAATRFQLPALVGRGERAAAVIGQGAEALLVVVAPVQPIPTSPATGAVVAEIPLAPLGARLLQGEAALRLVDGAGRTLAGEAAGWEGRLTARIPLELPPAFGPLGLSVEAGLPAAAARLPTLRILAFQLLVALAVLLAGLWAARRIARRVAEPIASLAESAWRISETGALATRVPVPGHDEVARLAAAFNEMLEQLQAAQAAVEAAHRSEQQEARGALRLAHAALERSTDAISIVEPDGTVVFANDVACQLLGRPREAVIGLKTYEADANLTAPRWAALWAALEASGHHAVERPTRLPSGATAWIELRAYRLVVGGAPYCVAIVRDVTARRQGEAALRLAGVGTLAAGAAHEINNPLTSILGNLAFVRDELASVAAALPPARAAQLQEADTAIGEAHQAAGRVRDVIRGLRVFSRPDEERQEPTDVAWAMSAAVEVTRNELRHRARVTTRYGVAPAVLGSRARLEQVFANLLVNAAQAIPEGNAAANEVAISVATGPLGEVVAEVRDTGAGMSPEVRARIFEPFFTTRPVGAGAGLGLAICHGIVADLGGRIEVESEPGRGTAVRVYLPAMAIGAGLPLTSPPPSEQPSPTPVPAAAEEGWVPLPAGARVLLVDDDALIGKVVIRSLAGGPEVVALVDGREALGRLVNGERFDVILCDLMMPDFSGMEFHAALQQARPDLADQVIFVTGGAFTPRARDFLASVRNECLKKPFEPEALRRLVAERLKARRGGPVPPVTAGGAGI